MTTVADQAARGFGPTITKGRHAGQSPRLAMQELVLGGTVYPCRARLVVRHTFQSDEKKPLEMIYPFSAMPP